MRCLFRLGCFAVLLVLGVAAWLTRDEWMPRVTGRLAPKAAPAARDALDPVSDAGAARTQNALNRLAQREGQVYEQLTGADVASLALTALAKDSGMVDSVRAGVVGNELRVHGIVNTDSVGGAVGVASVMLKAREPIELSGTMHVVRPGLGQFTITRVKIRDFTLPDGAIPAVVTAMSRGSRNGLSDRGFAVPLPDYIGDIRIANGRVTLYKTVR
jgi:hypothetical protein